MKAIIFTSFLNKKKKPATPGNIKLKKKLSKTTAKHKL